MMEMMRMRGKRMSEIGIRLDRALPVCRVQFFFIHKFYLLDYFIIKKAFLYFNFKK